MALTDSELKSATEKYYETVYKFCCSKCRSVDDAADITQEVFIFFCKNKDNLINTNLKYYLLSTANNKVHEYFNNINKDCSYMPLDECDFADYSTDIPETVNTEHFEELLNETQRKILNVLTDSEKRIFINLYIKKKTVKLVAEETGITENNVYAYSHRIKKKGKKIISDTKFLILVLTVKLFY